MENKPGQPIQDHWMKTMMESHNYNTAKPLDKEDARSVKREREKSTECFNGVNNADGYKTGVLELTPAQTVYQCDLCEQTFESLDYLNMHRKFHTGHKDASPGPGPKKRRKFKCDQCDVKVNSQYHLDIHRSKHEGSTAAKFMCQVCERTFVAPQFLKSHMMSHSNTSTINCEVCGKGFTGQAYLKLHMQLHSEVRKFKCPKCDEWFATKNCLKTHTVAKHSKIKNYKCDYCQKQFVSKITMEKHRQTHEPRQVDCLVQCSQCDRQMLSSLYKTHMERAHAPHRDDDSKRPFKCLTCGKNFLVKINLNLHIKVCHPELAVEESESSSNED